MRKCIEIRVQVHDVDQEEKFHRDPDFEPQSTFLFFDDEDTEIVHAEAEELSMCVERLVTA